MSDNRELLQAWFEHMEKTNSNAVCLFTINADNNISLLAVDSFTPDKVIASCEGIAKAYREKFYKI